MFRLENIKWKNIVDIPYLEIEKNKITCIVGASGSGKTSLMRMLNKMNSADSGEIFYNEKNLKDIDSINLRRKVVMLSQNPAIYPGTIRDNLQVGLKFSEKDLASDDKLKEALAFVGIEKNLDQNAEDLSGGEKQRVCIARVMLMDAEVFLFDEPSSALDQGTEEQVMDIIVKYVKKHKKTLIIVTHSKKLVESFAEKIIEIKSGKLLEVGN